MGNVRFVEVRNKPDDPQYMICHCCLKSVSCGVLVSPQPTTGLELDMFFCSDCIELMYVINVNG